MIHEYAIDPGAVFQKDGFWSLLKDFGISQGRVIVECPTQSWRKDLEQSLCRAKREFGDVAFSRLTERWAELKERRGIVRRRTDAKVDHAAMTWVLKIRPEHQRAPFHAVLAHEICESIPNMLSKQDIDLGSLRWQPETQMVVPRTADALADCAALLGQISDDLLLIDPYFNSDRKWQESLLAVLRTSNAKDRHFRRIEVHASESDRHAGREKLSKRTVLKKVLEVELPKKLPSGISVTFFVWKEREGGERYHRRYVLTERGGIYFEGGLDRGAEGHTTDVGLLSDNVWQERWSQYQRETAAFDLVGEPFVIKSFR